MITGLAKVASKNITPPISGLIYEKMETKYKSLRKAFRAIGEDGDQGVSWPELRRLLVTFNMNPNDRALHQLFSAADIDSGALNTLNSSLIW